MLVAVKEIKEKLYGCAHDKWYAVRSFLHEVKISSFVQHKNFAKLYGICIEEKFLIISEFIEGSPLDEVLRERIIEVPEAMNLIE